MRPVPVESGATGSPKSPPPGPGQPGRGDAIESTNKDCVLAYRIQSLLLGVLDLDREAAATIPSPRRGPRS